MSYEDANEISQDDHMFASSAVRSNPFSDTGDDDEDEYENDDIFEDTETDNDIDIDSDGNT